MTRKALLAALALACVLSSFAIPHAAFAEGVTAPPTAIVLPWGDWIVALGQAVTAVLVPVLVGLISRAFYQVAPWAMLASLPLAMTGVDRRRTWQGAW